MTTRLITTLTRSAVSTAVHVVRHPVGTATQAVVLAKGFAELGLDLVGGSRLEKTWTSADSPRAQAADVAEKAAETLEDLAEKAEAKAEDVADEVEATTEDAAVKADEETKGVVHHDDLPGPDVVARAVPKPDELPEPVVIEADDDAAPLPSEDPAGPSANDEDPVVYTSESSS